MKRRHVLTQAELREVAHYDERTGLFTWKKSPTVKSRVKIGEVFGSKTGTRGYLQVSIFHDVYLLHRLAWFYVHGVWPKAQIDHKDNNTSNNSIENLREATQLQNNANKKVNCTSRSQLKGVFRATKNSYRASIQVQGVVYRLGHFNTPEKAHAAYLAAAKKHFGEFARG